MTTTQSAVVTLPSDTTLMITREFDAPPRLVYRVWTEPDLVAQWWHANRGTDVRIEADVRVGGRWRYAMTAHDGFEVAFHGEYREVVPNQRLVTTEFYEGAPGTEPALTTATFVDSATAARVSTSSSSMRARPTATCTSSPAWSPACRTRSTWPTHSRAA